jgi:hypothetical protein
MPELISIYERGKLRDQVTFRERSFAVVDADVPGVLTTEWGNLAIFSTEGMAQHWARQSNRNLTVVPVRISLDLD